MWLGSAGLNTPQDRCTQRSLVSYFQELGSEIVGFGGLDGPLLPGSRLEKVGGEAPAFFDRFPDRTGPARSPKPTFAGPISSKLDIKDLWVLVG